MGRFLEEEVDTGVKFKNIFDMKKLEDGSLRIVGTEEDSGESGVWESMDAGETWKSVYNLPAEVQDRGISWLDYAALSPGGQIVCAICEIVSGGSGTRPVLYLVDKEGKANKMSFELPQENPEEPAGDAEQPETEEGEQQAARMNYISKLYFPGNEWVVLQDGTGTVYQINVSDSSVKYTYELNSDMLGAPLCAVGNTLIVQDAAQALCYDLQTGEQKPSEEILSQSFVENDSFRAIDTLDGGESVYILFQGGLYHYKFGGNVMEHIIDGSINSL